MKKLYMASYMDSFLLFPKTSLNRKFTVLIKSPESPKSFQEATKKFRVEILEIISLVFWKKLSFHKDIIKLTDL